MIKLTAFSTVSSYLILPGLLTIFLLLWLSYLGLFIMYLSFRHPQLATHPFTLKHYNSFLTERLDQLCPHLFITFITQFVSTFCWSIFVWSCTCVMCVVRLLDWLVVASHQWSLVRFNVITSKYLCLIPDFCWLSFRYYLILIWTFKLPDHSFTNVYLNWSFLTYLNALHSFSSLYSNWIHSWSPARCRLVRWYW